MACTQAPYVYEECADRWASLGSASKIELVFGAARLALCRPAQAAPVVRAILVRGLADGDLAVADAARLVRGAFAAGVPAARTLLSSATAGDAATVAADDTPDALLRELMLEFNTLAVLHGRPARAWVDRRAYALRDVPDAAAGAGSDAAAPAVTAAADEEGHAAEGDVMEESQEAQLLDFGDDDVAAVTELGAATEELDTLGLDGWGDSRPEASAASSVSFDTSPAAMDRSAFQGAWAELELTGVCATVRLPLSADQVAALMTQEADSQPRPFSGLHATLARRHIHVRGLAAPHLRGHCSAFIRCFAAAEGALFGMQRCEQQRSSCSY